MHRTNVYRFPTSLVEEHPNLIAVLCSDGVKDVLHSTMISAFFKRIDEGLAVISHTPREEAGFTDIHTLIDKVSKQIPCQIYFNVWQYP